MMFAPQKLVAVASLVAGLAAQATAQATPPLKYGLVMFPAVELQDAIGPIDPLQILAAKHNMTLYILSETMEPVSSQIPIGVTPFAPSVLPTHTFADAPDDIQVLIVPGGPGVRNLQTSAAAEAYIRATYPKLEHLITICTGGILAGRAGALDGKLATTNKSAWKSLTPSVPGAKWVAPARWIRDGNVWSSSGVLSGIDLIHAWIKDMFGEEEEQRIAGLTEYIPQTSQCDEPYTARFNITPTAEKCIEE
ncbi:hypothetical protein PspLS_03165 [Pyricularia sp. CBS 133598]|nr:hypothetical protein PspLS_03165 [Pyricularia sp. CBS 133598]